MDETMLYPRFDDDLFNLKISNKKEFSDTTYDGKIANVQQQAEVMSNSEFELAPHQIFVRNFLSAQTPYNGLLLYHGVGSGKTCSAITLSEEYREYMKQMGITKKILIVAADKVQENYKGQLFDASSLKEIDGRWTVNGCTGDKFLREIDPLKLKGHQKEDILHQVDKVVNQYYEFMGYLAFANKIEKLFEKTKGNDKFRKDQLKNEYEQRMIIIDEVQNIKVEGNIDQKNLKDKAASRILKMVSVVNTKLLLLSATPMFNSPVEIVWLLNLLNMNDKRRKELLKVKDVFLKSGSEEDDSSSNYTLKPTGGDTLEEWARGYVSFVRGENPYTFPYRIYPSMMKKPKKYRVDMDITNTTPYTPLQHLDVFMTPISGYQQEVYDKAAKDLYGKKEALNFYSYEQPMQILTMVYPVKDGAKPYGEDGFNEIVKFDQEKQIYSYKNEQVPKIFESSQLQKYSIKIKLLCDRILKSKGIILVFSRYISGGCLPIALALESIGITRYKEDGGKMMAGNYPQRDALTMKEGGEANACYTLITGKRELNSNPLQSIKMATCPENIDGKIIKVIIISDTGSEGIDLKNIRQIHIINPWYNMSKIEQIIGRGIRNRSHKDLPFAQRNAVIYLYTAYSDTVNDDDKTVETVDLHLYQLAESKAIQMGIVSRLLKQSAVDCILNKDQQNFTEGLMAQTVRQELSTRKADGSYDEIDYDVGDKPFSTSCDYMKTCQYVCTPENRDAFLENEDTYSATFLELNNDYIIRKIKQLFKYRYVYSKCEILAELNLVRKYSDLQISAALQRMVEDSSEYIYDQYNREGKLVNIKDYYYFHPLELQHTHVSMSDRRIPISVVKEKIRLVFEENPDVDSDESADEETDVRTTVETVETKYLHLLGVAKKLLPYVNAHHIENIDPPRIIVASLLEALNYTQTVAVINHALKNEQTELNALVLGYFQPQMFGRKYIRLINDHKPPYKTSKFSILKIKDSQLEVVDYDELVKIQTKKLLPPFVNTWTSNLNDQRLLGFKTATTSRNNTELVFKTVDVIPNGRNTGETCNTINQNRKSARNKLIDLVEKLKDQKKILKVNDICFLLETVLRHFDNVKKDDKRWFLTPMEYILWMMERTENKKKMI